MKINFTYTHIFLIFSFLYLISGNNLLFAQKTKADVVYLKNGTILYGSIIQFDSVKGMRINNDCGSYLFHFQDIDSVKTNYKKISNSQKSKGYYNLTSVGLLFGEGGNGFQPLPSLTMVNGYQIDKHWSAGLGFGFEFYEFSVFPVFAQGTYVFKNDKISPFISLKSGYTFPIHRSTDKDNGLPWKTFGGIAVNPEIGIKVDIGDKNAFICSLGYHYQKLSFEDNYYDYFYESNYYRRIYNHFNRISFRIGFLFR